ncbi:MAG TPA: hypothetical protein VEQ11_00995 [Chloroflexota bacterium]|nr:hypothetical protein [Chloroflexota bacterium]
MRWQGSVELWVRGAVGLLVGLSVVGLVSWPGVGVGAQQDERYFSDTGFRIDHDGIWDYFSKRGRIRTFGLPTSRTFQFLGAPTQFFQRQIVQVSGGGVRTLNFLDEFLAYTRMNGSTFPGVDPEVTGKAPKAESAGYDAAVVEFVRQVAPDEYEGEAVRFYETFVGTVTLADAFPEGGGNAGLVGLLNLELWGQPTSRPARDPGNGSFIYQRFQRGIMHYDAGCGCTQGLLLADMLKAVLTGQNLPPDLAAEAAGSKLYKQYDPDRHTGPLRPEQLPGTDLANAFRLSLDSTPAAAARPATGKPAAAQAEKPGPVGQSVDRDPRDIMTTPDEAGRQADLLLDKEGSEDRGRWAHRRWERNRESEDTHTGPIVVDSLVWVAKDVSTAQAIFNDESARQADFPEAADKRQGHFDFKIAKIGDDVTTLSACDDCNANRTFNLHHRIVARKGNVVAVLYLFGRESNTTQKLATWYISQILFRV